MHIQENCGGRLKKSETKLLFRTIYEPIKSDTVMETLLYVLILELHSFCGLTVLVDKNRAPPKAIKWKVFPQMRVLW